MSNHNNQHYTHLVDDDKISDQDSQQQLSSNRLSLVSSSTHDNRNTETSSQQLPQVDLIRSSFESTQDSFYQPQSQQNVDDLENGLNIKKLNQASVSSSLTQNKYLSSAPNMIIVKIKMVNNQQKDIEIDYNSDITIAQFKEIAFKEQLERQNAIVKLIYQGKLLHDDKLMKDLSNIKNLSKSIVLDLKVNPYIHASIVQVEPEEQEDEESVNNQENQQRNGFDLNNYLAILQDYQNQIRATQQRMRSDISIQRPRRSSQDLSGRGRRPGNNRRAIRFANSLFQRNRFGRQEPTRPQFYSNTGDGNCADLAWGFILGFILPFPFVIMILLCHTKKMAKTGILLGYIVKIYFNLSTYAYQQNYSTTHRSNTHNNANATRANNSTVGGGV